MQAFSQNSKTKRIFAGLLAVWMSGIVFLLCCGAMQAKSGAEIESCPLAKSEHCGKSKSGNPNLDESDPQIKAVFSESASFDCCGFLPYVFNKIKKSENIQQIVAVKSRVVIDPPSFISIKNEPENFFSYCSRPLNKSGTYLKNRIFRI